MSSNQETYAVLRNDTVSVSVIFNEPLLGHRKVEGEVQVSLRSGTNLNPHTLKTYTYKALVSDGVQPGDVVMVTAGSNGEIKVVQVVEVNDINAISGVRNTKWILGRLDLGRIGRILDQENQFVRALEQAKAKQAQTDTLKKLMANHGEAVTADIAALDGMKHVGNLLQHNPEPSSAE